jgi:hypothetical protein
VESALTLPNNLSEEENAARSKAINDSSNAITAIGNDIQALRTDNQKIEIALSAAKQANEKLAEAAKANSKIDIDGVKRLLSGWNYAKQAIEQLENLKGAAERYKALTETNGFSPEDIQALEDKGQEVQEEIHIAQLIEQTQKLAKQIAQNKLIADALAPEGVRKMVVSRGVEQFNKSTAYLSNLAGWPIVNVTEDLNVSYGGRAYVLLSESEKFRCRITLQCVMAKMDKSEIMVIDAADILDKFGKNGLFGILAKVGIRTLVTMTLAKPESMPNMAANNMGQSIWIS